MSETSKKTGWLNRLKKSSWKLTAFFSFLSLLIGWGLQYHFQILDNRHDAIRAEMISLEQSSAKMLEALTNATNAGFESDAVYRDVKKAIPAIDAQYFQIGQVAKYLEPENSQKIEAYKHSLLSLKKSVRDAQDIYSFRAVYQNVQEVLIHHDAVVAVLYDKSGVD